MRPADIVGVLANEKGIPGNQIGRISLLERKPFVGLPRAVAEALLKDAETLCVRGEQVAHRAGDSLAAAAAGLPLRAFGTFGAQGRASERSEPTGPSAGADRTEKAEKQGGPVEPGKPGEPTRPDKPMWAKLDKRPRRSHVASRRPKA